MTIDNVIKTIAVEVITDRLAILKGDQFKNVGKTIPLHQTDLESITEAFETAYSTVGYVDGSACICSSDYSSYPDVSLCYSVRIETILEEREKQIIDRINKGLHFTIIYHKLLALGYKRVWADYQKLKDFDDTTIYGMFMNDQDRLAMYYQLYFTKG